jgi:cytochrome c-type biogenesis protein CcmH
MFWIIAAGLLVAAGLFVAVPLLRSSGSRALQGGSEGGSDTPAESADAVVRALYRDRVAELEAEAAAGRLDPEIRQQVMEELGTSLLDDYREFEAAPAAPAAAASDAASARRVGWVLAVLLPVAAFGVYWSVGEPTADAVAGAVAVLQLDPEQDRAEIERWRERLARRVALEPDDAQSWYLLGSTGLQLGEFGAAEEAFAKAAAITGPDAVIDVYWLQARYLAQGGTLDATTREIADRVLAQRGNHPLVLEIYAIDAYRRGAYREAVGYLNRALSNELGAAQLQALLAGLDEARAQMGPILPRIEIAVSASAEAPPGATLFVIARPPGGGMPYAVIRRPASMLPLTVQLDDTVSMNPDLPLSGAPAFEVVVRLSRSGTPAAQPGDWEWRSAAFAAADLAEPVRLDAALAPPESTAPGT